MSASQRLVCLAENKGTQKNGKAGMLLDSNMVTVDEPLKLKDTQRLRIQTDSSYGVFLEPSIKYTTKVEASENTCVDKSQQLRREQLCRPSKEHFIMGNNITEQHHSTILTVPTDSSVPVGELSELDLAIRMNQESLCDKDSPEENVNTEMFLREGFVERTPKTVEELQVEVKHQFPVELKGGVSISCKSWDRVSPDK